MHNASSHCYSWGSCLVVCWFARNVWQLQWHCILRGICMSFCSSHGVRSCQAKGFLPSKA